MVYFNLKVNILACNCSLVVGVLASRSLGTSSTLKTKCGSTNCNPGAWGVEAGGSDVRAHLQLLREFEARLGYIDHSSKTTENKTKQSTKKKNTLFLNELNIPLNIPC